jgi:hypothetical protein
MTTLGTCPVCSRLYTLTESGKMPDHLEKQSSGRQAPPRCGGVGQQPIARTTEK